MTKKLKPAKRAKKNLNPRSGPPRVDLHFIGLCGTFMAGAARLAKEAGFSVAGSDRACWPPMSDEIARAGIRLFSGYRATCAARPARRYLVGNAISRGCPLLESVLQSGADYDSAPAWLRAHALANKTVIAVAGTHGKTTTTALVAWLLEKAGAKPGFLAGGALPNFGASARLGAGRLFVVEADEYDTAFFDKRPKFMHYHPRWLAVNNLEFDHADIYKDEAAIVAQFALLARTVPPHGAIFARKTASTGTAFAHCYSPLVWLKKNSAAPQWHTRAEKNGRLKVFWGKSLLSQIAAPLFGEMNRRNMEMALSVADRALAEVSPKKNAAARRKVLAQALESFVPPRRRLQHIASAAGADIYDDFAHHPTAYAATLAALAEKLGGKKRRIIAVMEARSNSMKAGVFDDQLAAALSRADKVFACGPAGLRAALRPLGARAQTFRTAAPALDAVARAVKPNDAVLIMSNGDFENFPRALASRLAAGKASRR